MPTAEHWRELAEQFLYAKRSGDKTAKSLLESLGRRGASWFEPPPSGDFYVAWMNAVQEHNKGEALPRRVVALCELSADLCSVLEREAIERELRPQRSAAFDMGLRVPAVAEEREAKGMRRAMLDAYLAQFHEKIVLLDVCWAVRQRYRELKRWLAGESKGNSKPDRAFRALLTSRKRPQQYRPEPRPPKWQ